jgi:hypothetical protein
MMPEKNTVSCPEAQRQLELDWIGQNAPLFSAKASGYFGLVGRGAIIVDAATKPLSESPLFTYFSKEQMEHIEDMDINDMVDGYNPEKEFIILLLLPENQTRAYRIDVPAKEEMLTGESGTVEYAGT